MDFESIKRCWREETQPLPPLLEEETVMRMLTNRTTDLRAQVRRRLRREAGYYVPIMVVSAVSLVGGFTLNRLLAAAAVLLMLGAVMATLWWAERRIDEAPLDRSLREALTDLESKVDAAGRAYVAVYVALFVASAASRWFGGETAWDCCSQARWLWLPWPFCGPGEADAATSSRCFDTIGWTCPSASASSRNTRREPPERPRTPDLEIAECRRRWSQSGGSRRASSRQIPVVQGERGLTQAGGWLGDSGSPEDAALRTAKLLNLPHDAMHGAELTLKLRHQIELMQGLRPLLCSLASLSERLEPTEPA
jgi:hypothetical protein